MSHESAMSNEPIVVWHEHEVTRAQREALAGHRGAVVWFTGLSGSGKSTIAGAAAGLLHARGVRTYVLDGDNVRHGLCATPAMLAPQFGDEFARRFGLGFAPQDRTENIRRVGEVARLLSDAGVLTLTAFVSPYRADRDAVRRALGGGPAAGGDFFEVFVDTPLAVCEARDPKGLYAKARAGEIRHFTGIDDPYEAPESPELVLPGGGASVAELAGLVVLRLQEAGLIPPDAPA